MKIVRGDLTAVSYMQMINGKVYMQEGGKSFWMYIGGTDKNPSVWINLTDNQVNFASSMERRSELYTLVDAELVIKGG